MANGRNSQSELLQLVYESAVSTLDAQRATVDELRGRAATILSAASLTSSVFGAITIAGDAFSIWAQLAVVAFVALGVLVIAILWPYEWQFGFDPHELVTDYVDAKPPASIDETRRNLAIFAGDYLLENDRNLSRLWWLYRSAIVALILLGAFWLIGLGIK